jgi:cytochrome c oxidase subunit II
VTSSPYFLRLSVRATPPYLCALVGGTAVTIGISYLVVVVIGLLIAAGIWRSTRSRRPADPERLARRERTWLFVVVGLLVALLFGTIFFAPYGQGASGPHQVVNVQARQFFWAFRPARVRAGERVEFRLTSKDVNHNFAVYDPSSTYLFQAQVVPGKVQKVFHTFHRPGTYHVLCLEYCGVGHHSMQGTFEVVR